MAIPFFKEMRIGGYLIKEKLLGGNRCPLVLMLEPLFRCNLACVGCGKIDYPDAILNRRMSVQECLDAVDDTGDTEAAFFDGVPLIHKDTGAIVKGIVARKKFVSLFIDCPIIANRGSILRRKSYLFFSVHLDGL